MDDEADDAAVPPELLEYLTEVAGETLRGVVHYDHDSFGFELLGDVEAEYDESGLRAIVEDLRLQDIAKPAQGDLFSVGELYCTLRAFDEAIMLHFIQGDDRGTVVSLRPEAAPQLTEFIYESLAILDRYSEQEIARAPSWKA